MSYTLITGGAGYIGSHICLELHKKNIKNIIIVDNFSKSKDSMFAKLQKMIPTIQIYNFNLSDKQQLRNLFKIYDIKNVIHLAAFKSVGESIKDPLKYYDNNVINTIHLLEVMDEFDCKNLIFSSSATVYGNQTVVPIRETASTYEKQTNPYGKSKLMIEMILRDLTNIGKNWNIVILRYFNPVACDNSGEIGEDPKEKPSNLFPHILKVLDGSNPKLNIYGGDYSTVDGTCIRDFIHVTDLAEAHISACDFILNKKDTFEIFNIGTGNWYSVLQIVNRFNELTDNKVPYEIKARREGDIPYCFADCNKADIILKWKAKKTLDDMINDCINRIDKLNK